MDPSVYYIGASQSSHFQNLDQKQQGNENKTIVYFIKTENKTGFYDISFNCGGIPIAV